MAEKRSRRFGVLAAFALTCLPGTTVAQGASVPVIAGQNPGYDACGRTGLVHGLDPKGDGFLAVCAGPGSGYAMLDKIYNDALINICDERGKWLGVVYSHETEDCGVSTPWPRPAAYTGPCRSGWIYRTHVKDFAG